jgi:hypothetical protein
LLGIRPRRTASARQRHRCWPVDCNQIDPREGWQWRAMSRTRAKTYYMLSVLSTLGALYFLAAGAVILLPLCRAPPLHPVGPTEPADPSRSQSPRRNRPPPVPLAARGRIGACAVSRTARSGLARTLSLNRWARHRAIRAEHAAIALPWMQRRAAADTFVEELAGINRHGFRFGGSAMRAGDNAFKDHGAYLCTSPRYSITICPSTVGSGHLRR